MKVDLDNVTGPFIQLRSGQYIDLRDPDYSEVQIEELAHSLAHLCRYTGHTKHFYSVAEHCWIASIFGDPDHALEILLHDLAEAVLGDVSSPLKSLLPDYKRMEKIHEERLAERFGVPFPFHPSVADADMRMLATERHQLLENAGIWTVVKDVQPYDAYLECLHPKFAMNVFLSRYYELTEMAPA